jgi:acetate kinase
MAEAILVLNAGSSSLKFSLYTCAAAEAALSLLTRGQCEALYTAPKFTAKDATGRVVAQRDWGAGATLGHDGAIAYLLDHLEHDLAQHRLVAVGHRVVHGGMAFERPVRVDAGIVAQLETLIPLAPLHQPHNLAPMRALLARAPQLPQIACFDTAFHRTMPALAQTFALPESITARGVRSYGFHGLSYEYIVSALPAIDPAAAAGRVVIAHLGNGASMCAVHAGRSMATTMGFTPLDGLPMGTRTGALDPGVLLYLMDELKMDARALERMLYHESGLLGVSGVSSDMRELLASDDPRAHLAVELFVYRIGRELGSLAAALGGLDALVFTGGIGEHAAPIREGVLRAAAWLGFEVDSPANAIHAQRITAGTSRAQAYVIPTNEELMIARHCLATSGSDT